MRIVAIIPARMGSTRFPGKPLVEIAGKPLIQWVWERAAAAKDIDDIVVATDSDAIAEAVRAFGGRPEMTRNDHVSGSDRLAEAVERIEADAIINLQGDEPLVRSADLERLALMMRNNPVIDVASLCHAITADEAENPNRVKVVRDGEGDALYFSRARIPHPRDPEAASYFQHMGVYAYSRAALLAFPNLPVSDEERAESLEQLRFLHAGYKIRLLETESTGPGVDTPEDVGRVEKLLMAGE